MQTSYPGRCMLGQEEAIVLVPYNDGKHMSIGAGHNDPALKPGVRITLEQALALLAADLIPREKAVEKMLHVPVDQHQFDALLDAYYNKGSHVLPVVDLINKGRISDAMDLLLTINRNEAGTYLAGLARRRERERHLFMTGDYGDLSTVKVWSGDPRSTRPDIVPMPGSLAATVAAPTF